MKHTFFVFYLLISFIPLSNSASADELAALDEPPFAAILPLSGNGAAQGLWIQRGLEMAHDDAKLQGLVAPELVFEDSQGENNHAVSAFKNLLSVRVIPLVFSWGSGVGLSLAPLVNRSKIVQIGVATNAEGYSAVGDFNYRNFPKASQETAFLAEVLAKRLSFSKIVIVHTENDYGTSTAEMLGSEFLRLGGTILDTLELQPGETDSRAQVLSLRRHDADAIFLSAYPIEGAAFLKNLRQQGNKLPVVASAALFSSNKTIAELKDVFEGLIQVAPMPSLTSNREFGTRYEHRYKEAFGAQNFYTIRAYDSYMIAAKAYAACSKPVTGSCIKTQLDEMPPYHGLGGVIDFDSSGDVSSVFSAYRVVDGVYRELETTP